MNCILYGTASLGHYRLVALQNRPRTRGRSPFFATSALLQNLPNNRRIKTDRNDLQQESFGAQGTVTSTTPPSLTATVAVHTLFWLLLLLLLTQGNVERHDHTVNEDANTVLKQRCATTTISSITAILLAMMRWGVSRQRETKTLLLLPLLLPILMPVQPTVWVHKSLAIVEAGCCLIIWILMLFWRR